MCIRDRSIIVNLLPSIDVESLLIETKNHRPKVIIRTVLNEHLPRNLVLELESLWWSELKEKPLAECSNEQLSNIGRKINAWKIMPAGTEGYKTAEVTLGGVDTDYLSSKSMQAKTQAGLYFVGEVVDVTGHLGGFNFQWAWSSGYACGSAL